MKPVVVLSQMLAAQPRSATPGVVQLDITRREDVPLQRLSRRAAAAVTADLANNVTGGAYVTTVQVGTPPQTLTLQVDTGSSDTWLPWVKAPICTSGECFYGSFDPDKSSTFTDVSPDTFSIAYADNTSSRGDYITDDITIGGTKLTALTMGLAKDTDNQYGLVGVGLPANEAILQTNPDGAYVNLPLALVTQGKIASPAYSLWLNNIDAPSGNMLFGGVDTAKFSGNLQRMALLPRRAGSSTVTSFVVGFTSLTANSASGSDKLGSAEFPMKVVLDSGSTSSYLPKDLIAQMYKVAGVVQDSRGTPLIPCSAKNGKGSFAFGFGGPGGPTINVDMSQIVRKVSSALKFTSGPYNGQDACIFSFFPGSPDSSAYIFGDSFLRSAYVVYDLMNEELAIANTKFNVGESNIVAFPSKSATIPNSTPIPTADTAAWAAAAVTTTPTTFAAAAGFTSTSGASSFARASPAGLLGVTVVSAAMMLLGSGSFFLL